MRTEEKVMELILTFARSHDEIRAVVMNGSRANPNNPKDLFCDYDVVYYVPDPRRFLEDQSWIRYFGDLVILQQNDFHDHDADGYIFLMLFSDGVRIDLAFDPLSYLAFLGEDTATILLLDKDGRIRPLPPASDLGYYTPRPPCKEFNETINEIFWCSNNVAKGIWRDELPYAKYMFDVIIRPCMEKVLAWYIADQHGWQIDTGKYGKWLKRYLPEEIWEGYVATYAGANYEEIWEALSAMHRLTRQVGPVLAASLGYHYPLEDDRRTVSYLQRVRALPRGATSFDGH